MRSIFDFESYREYLKHWIEGQGERAYGARGRIAASLSVSSSLVSLVLKGEKSFTPDQASDLADHLGLSDAEAEYLHVLVELDRAGNPRYRDKLVKKRNSLRKRSRSLGTRVPRERELTDQQRAIYYSSWIYTGIRNLTAVPNYGGAAAIAERLHLDIGVVNTVVRFLVENGLCRDESGTLSYGPASTHVDKESPFVNKHHQNWRFQALQKMERRRDEDLFFTSPMSLSRDAFEEIRRLLPNVVQSVMKISGPSPSETVACLNIDWFEY